MFESVARCRIGWDDFWDMTWGEFSWFIEGYRLNEVEDWKRARLIAMTMYNAFSQKPIDDPEKFMPLEEKPKTLKWKPLPKKAYKRGEVLVTKL